MIALDTNLLVYAHRRDSMWHAKARETIRELAEGRAPWAIPWPSLHEFLAIVTHPRIYKPPSALSIATEQVSAWLESPTLVRLSENDSYLDALETCLVQGRVVGPHIHDARIAALCIAHGVRELWTHDRDYGRFPSLSVRNPLM